MEITKQNIEDLLQRRTNLHSLMSERRVCSVHSNRYTVASVDAERFIVNYPLLCTTYENYPDTLANKVEEFKEDIKLLIQYSVPKSSNVETPMEEVEE